MQYLIEYGPRVFATRELELTWSDERENQYGVVGRWKYLRLLRHIHHQRRGGEESQILLFVYSCRPRVLFVRLNPGLSSGKQKRRNTFSQFSVWLLKWRRYLRENIIENYELLRDMSFSRNILFLIQKIKIYSKKKNTYLL